MTALKTFAILLAIFSTLYLYAYPHQQPTPQTDLSIGE